MPLRIPHSKSRLGCKQCKQRRVKCNEEGPVCYNCQRRGFDCSFRYHGAPQKPNSLLGVHGCGHSPSLSSSSWTTLSGRQDPFSRATELELLHHYCMSEHCVETLVLQPEELHRLKVDFPKWSLKDAFLMDSILCVSALHTASLGEEDSCIYGDLAIAYQERALRGFREAIKNPSAEQCPAIFYTSAIISVTALAIRGHRGLLTDLPVATLVGVHRLLAGTAAIVDVGMAIMGKDDWYRAFPETPEPATVQLAADVVDVLIKLDVMAQNADDHLTATEPNAEPIWIIAVNKFRHCFATINSHPNAILAWCFLAGSGFMMKLESGDSLAQLITLCFSVLVHDINFRWWACGFGRALGDELSGPVSAVSPDFADIADWVTSRLKSDIDVAFRLQMDGRLYPSNYNLTAGLSPRSVAA